MSKKDELPELLVNVPKVAREAQAFGDRISRSAQSAEDYARSELKIPTQVDENDIPREMWDRSIEGLRGRYGAAAQLNAARPHADVFVASGFSNATSSSNLISCVIGLSGKVDYGAVRELAENAKSLLARLQLDVARNDEKSAAELLTEAQAERMRRPSAG